MAKANLYLACTYATYAIVYVLYKLYFMLLVQWYYIL